jgi:hypothetical protein
MSRRLAALLLAIPLAAAAQTQPTAPTPPAPATEPAPAVATSPATPVAAAVSSPAVPVPAPAIAPAAPAAAPAAPSAKASDDKPTFDFSGWFVTNGYRGVGGLNAVDLPTFAADKATVQNVSRGVGIGAGQSRLRVNAGIPADGLLGGAKLKGLVEIDFQGVLAGNSDRSLPTLRLRHAWIAASWPELGKLQVLAGQSWGVFTGPLFAQSLAHLAVPRFAGAGFLFRRAPQVRVSGEFFAPVALVWQAAALAPVDNSTSSNVRVGERSGLPDFEGRVAAAFREGKKTVAEVGLSGRYGRELCFLDATGANQSVDSWGGAVDAKLDTRWVTVLGGGYFGQALSVFNTAAPDVKVTRDASTPTPKVTGVTPVHSRGFWAQGIAHALPVLDLAVGYGVEDPRNSDLAAQTAVSATVSTSTIVRNRQWSGAAFLQLTSRWRVSAEGTWYVTNTYDGMERNATQFEVGSLFAF